MRAIEGVHTCPRPSSVIVLLKTTTIAVVCCRNDDAFDSTPKLLFRQVLQTKMHHGIAAPVWRDTLAWRMARDAVRGREMVCN